jgi:hypothetical protein
LINRNPASQVEKFLGRQHATLGQGEGVHPDRFGQRIRGCLDSKEYTSVSDIKKAC